MTHEHIVKSYDEELRRLSNAILRMGGAVEVQLTESVRAVVNRDSEAALKTIESDRKIDELEAEIDQLGMRLLALRQPLAIDLRETTAALKISSDLERIGDYTANISKRAIALNQLAPVRPIKSIPRMAEFVQGMIKDVLDAYVERDVEKALAVWWRDEELDEMYNGLFRELLTYMMEDPRSITPCTHLLFIAKNIERIGDHLTNIAEMINFLVTGERQPGTRPKGDATPMMAELPKASAEKGPGGR